MSIDVLHKSVPMFLCILHVPMFLVFCVIQKVLFWECAEKVWKSIDFMEFLSCFSMFLLRCGYWNRYGIEKYCKNWKEKIFVLRMYFCIYMFGLCSEKFRAAAIEKNCILIELYQNSRTKTGSRKEDKKARFYYRKCVLFECEKIV